MTQAHADQIHAKLTAMLEAMSTEYGLVFSANPIEPNDDHPGFTVFLSGVDTNPSQTPRCTQEDLDMGFADPGTRFWVDPADDGEWFEAVIVDAVGSSTRRRYVYAYIGYHDIIQARATVDNGFCIVLPDGAKQSADQLESIRLLAEED